MNVEVARLKLERIIQVIKKYRLILRFLLIGGNNAFASFIFYVLFIKVLGAEHYQISLLASWCFSSFLTFILQKLLVFKTKGNWLKEYKRFLLSWFIGYCLNAVSLAITVHWLAMHVILSQLIALSVITLTTFLLFKFYAFNIKNREE